MQQVESKMEDVELILEEQYHLVAVISHHGNNLMSGHYTASTLRNGQWFNLSESWASLQEIKRRIF
jgi:ubiquitin C-terminal hydrolase